MAWRAAQSITSLREQVNAAAPRRAMRSDGVVGDLAHQKAGTSDHLPDRSGVVRATDITHDPTGGMDAHALAQRLLDGQDPRLKYVISNGRIGSGPAGPAPGRWRPYTGANRHDHHAHVSVVPGAAGDRPGPWHGVTPTTPAITLEELLTMNLDDRIESRNPDSKGKDISVRELLQDVQANAATAARDADRIARAVAGKK